MKREIYAARTLDRTILKSSSSGGMFTLLSDAALDNGDAIVCNIYNYNTHKTEMNIVLDKKDRDLGKGSKYVQSDNRNIFKECSAWLREHPKKKVMFFGTGCQAAGFKCYMEKLGLIERCCLIDIICHGVGSPRIWRDYVNLLETKYQGHITSIDFKDKRNGWLQPTAVAKLNDQEYALDCYVKIFFSRCALRPSCHVCPYATVDRDTDITIGDYWNIEKTMPNFYDELGTSLVILHTNQGIEVFDKVKSKTEFSVSNEDDCLQPNLIEPTKPSSYRGMFWRDYDKKGIEYVYKRYGKDSMAMKVKNKIHYMLKK